MDKGKKTIQCAAIARGAKGVTSKTADPVITSKNTFTKPSIPIKVLGTSNRTTLNPSKMGISQATSTRLSTTSRRMTASSSTRLSTTSRRMTASYHTTQRLKKTPTTLAKRMTMDTRSFNQKANNSSTILFDKPKKTSDKLSCPDPSCGMTFFYQTSLAAHIKSHATQNTCKHCGRRFAIPAPLSAHLREHCSKISIAERKRLLEADAKLEKQKTPARSPRLTRATEELLDLVFTSCSTSSKLDRLKAVPFKEFAPIKGIGRTPRKMIHCIDCGEKFKNPLEFAMHAEHCVAPKLEL